MCVCVRACVCVYIYSTDYWTKRGYIASKLQKKPVWALRNG